LDVSGNTLVVGAAGSNNGGSDAGSAFVFYRNFGGSYNWGEVTILYASNAQADDEFGSVVSVHGNIIAVGAYGEDTVTSNAGAAYVYHRNSGGADNWAEVNILLPLTSGFNSFFGSTAIDGNVVVSGVWADDVQGSRAGAVVVFYVPLGETCDDGNTLDGDGCDGDCYGDVLANSDCGDAVRNVGNGEACDDGNESAGDGCAADCMSEEAGWNCTEDSGSGLSSCWPAECGDGVVAVGYGAASLLVEQISASDGFVNDRFGISVSLSGDFVVSSAVLEDTQQLDAGAAYIFHRNMGGTNNWGEVTILYASDGAINDYFGFSSSISGDVCVVGAHLDDDDGASSGSAYVFHRNMGGVDNWGQVRKLLASDAQGGDFFGRSVSVSGDYVLAGAWGEDTQGTDAGAAYLFARNMGGVDSWGEVVILYASDAEVDNYFGRNLSIDGDSCAIGAFRDDHAGVLSGSAYIFSRDVGGADNWGQVQKLVASDAEAADFFGLYVSISKDHAIVGAIGEDTAGVGLDAGAAYIYYRNMGGANNWGEITILYASNAEPADYFGDSVSIDGDIVVVGASGVDTGGSNAGAAYIYHRNSGGADNWGELNILYASNSASEDRFGTSVSISGGYGVIGAYLQDAISLDAGAAYVYKLAVGELCDDGNTDDYDGCSGDCTTVAACGDGNLDNVSPATEDCDDGDLVDGDGCSSLCADEVAGGNPLPPAGDSCIDLGGITCEPLIVVVGAGVGVAAVSVVIVCGAAAVVMMRLKRGHISRQNTFSAAANGIGKQRPRSLVSITPASNPDGLGVKDMAFIHGGENYERPKSIESGMTVASEASTATGAARKKAIANMIMAMNDVEDSATASEENSTSNTVSASDKSNTAKALAMELSAEDRARLAMELLAANESSS